MKFFALFLGILDYLLGLPFVVLGFVASFMCLAWRQGWDNYGKFLEWVHSKVENK